MKYLFITQTLGEGGAERMVSRLATALTNLKHEVHIILSYKIEDEYETKCTNVHYVANNKHNYNSLNRLKRVFKIRQFINSIHPDVIIPFMEHICKYAIYSTILSKYRKKIIITIRDNPELWNRHSLFKLLHKSKLRVTQNEGQKSFFPESLRKKIVVIPNFIDDDLFEYKKEYHNKIHKIISVGRLVDQKNYNLLLEAINICKNLDIQLTIYGNGPLKSEIQSKIAYYNLENKVFLEKFTRNINEKYLQSDLYVMSSNFEGMPNTLLEASALGLPIISTNCHFGPSDIITNGVNGILVPCNDAKKLATAIKYLVENHKIANNFGKNGKVMMKEKYSKDRIVSKWEKLPLLIRESSGVKL